MDVIKKIAQALWRRERDRAEHCDAVLGSIRGQAIKPTMDPFEDHDDMWTGDARAALTALAENISDEMVEAAWAEINFTEESMSGNEASLRRAIAAAIRAAAKPTGEV